VPKLTFDEKEHKYFIDGVWVPSVTQIISPLSSYGAIPKKILDNACDRGKKIDEMCEFYLDGRLEFNSLSDSQKRILEQFVRFLDTEGRGFDFDSVITKYRGCNIKLKYAGESDIIIPDQAIIDIKTRYKSLMPLTDPLQLFGYEGIWPGKERYKHYILALYEKKYKFTEVNKTRVEYNQSKSRFRYLLDKVWNDIEFKQKINNWKETK